MPTAIAELVPAPRLREVDRIAVAADPTEAWKVVRATDLYQLGFVRLLFTLRTLPERVGARLRGKPVQPAPRSARLDEIVGPGSAFRRLAEVPGEEFVAGAIGKFWKPAIPFVDTSAETFAAFDEPGYGKVAWSLQVKPRTGGGAWVEVDLRVDATDDDAWRAFTPYWRLIGRFSRTIRRRLLHEIAGELGHVTADAERTLPGDDILPRAQASRTHAVTIEARPDCVWPWLAQMGCRRAGWYSIDRLDNGGVPSADHIVPELQQLEVGDVLPATPESDEGFAVLRVEPERLLVLGSPSLASAGPQTPPSWGMFGARYAMTWAFVLEPIGDEATRLIVRVRGAYEPVARNRIATPALLLAHEVMESAQLRNLKRRAEGKRAGADDG